MSELYHRREPLVKNCCNGLIIDTGSFFRKMEKKRPSRGNIKGFSASSRRRLKTALISYDAPQGWHRYGICFTVPGQVDNWMDDWLATVERFRTALTRGMWNHAGIYRVELQTRGMPHIHAIMWTDAPTWEFGAIEISSMWQKSLKGWVIDGKSCFDRFLHGITVKWDEVTRDDSIRYLFDHTTKSKQAQLGYTGKQWGFWCRKHLAQTWEGVPLKENQIIVLTRVVRRWSKTFYKRKNKGRLTRCRMGTASYLVPLNSPLKRKLLEWISGNE